MVLQYYVLAYSCDANGLEISSSPSTGLSRVIVGPRSTARPSVRVRGSGSARTKGSEGNTREAKKKCIYTLHLFLHFIQDEIEQLVITFEHAGY